MRLLTLLRMCRASPQVALRRHPYFTLPYLTLPYLTLPYLALPYLALPCLTFRLVMSCYAALPFATLLLRRVTQRLGELHAQTNQALMDGYEVPEKLQGERHALETAIAALRRTLKAMEVRVWCVSVHDL